MSENEIKPVAWRCIWNKSGKPAWEQYHDENDPMPAHWDVRPNEVRALYDQSAIDRLTAERDAALVDAKRLRSVIEYALAQHNYGCLPLQNHWAAKAMSELAAIDGARAEGGV